MLDVFQHEDAVYGLAVDPINDFVFASACDDGRILIYDIRASPSEGSSIRAMYYFYVDARCILIMNNFCLMRGEYLSFKNKI